MPAALVERASEREDEECEPKLVASAKGWMGMGAVGSGGGAGVLKSLFRPLRKEEPGLGGGRKARLEEAVTSLGDDG
jgi:hypothetical protein